MRIRAFFQSLLENIFVDKYNCIICGREIKGGNRYGMCVRCMSELVYIGYPCKKCGKPLNIDTDYCLMCQNNERHFNRVYSALEYSGKTERMIYDLKFGGKKYKAKYLSALLADLLLNEGLRVDFVVAMPLHERRLKERGYNQAALLAESLASRLGLPIRQCIERVKETQMQAKTSGQDRISNVRDAFVAVDSCKGKRVLLVDDVLTTGATMSEAAKALKKAGAIEVIGITLANVRDKLIKSDKGGVII